MINSNPNLSLTKTPVQTRPAAERVKDFEEVELGYTLAEAQAEARRCLNCPDRYCAASCPAHNYIPEFIEQIRLGDLLAAWELLSRTNPFMELSGRVCPCESQCEANCTRSIKGEPVAIGRLERFVADWHRKTYGLPPEAPEANGRSAAIVGSGPAGIGCAASLVLSGFHVDIYEKSDRPGGVPVWGIPSFVLPAVHMQRQIDHLTKLGVIFHLNTEVGRDVALEQLRAQHDVVFVATGAGQCTELAIEGRALRGVVQAEDYLKNPAAYEGKTVLVLGGGNTAIDAARTAIRRGADSVSLVYRRTAQDMPAAEAEKAVAREEGVKLIEQAAPVRFLGEDGHVAALECDRMQLTAPDYPGGRNNVAPSGETLSLETDLVILALGFEPVALPGLPCDERGRAIVDKNYATELDGVYAGGDAVTGAATLIKAVAAGKDAAAAIFTRFCD